MFDVVESAMKRAASAAEDARPKAEAKLAIEIAATNSDVVAVGEAEAGLRQHVVQGMQNAGLAGTGIAEMNNANSLRKMVDRAKQPFRRIFDGGLRWRGSVSLVLDPGRFVLCRLGFVSP